MKWSPQALPSPHGKERPRHREHQEGISAGKAPRVICLSAHQAPRGRPLGDLGIWNRIGVARAVLEWPFDALLRSRAALSQHTHI